MYKKVILIVVIILMVGGVIVGFSLFNNNQDKELTGKKQDITNENENIDVNVEKSDDALEEGTRIKLSINDNEIYVKLNNSKSSTDLLRMLPLTLEFEDFNNTEKIGYLPRNITTEDAPSGYTPEVGDFSYYAPWGNLSIFYKDFRYSDSLIKLGEIESGVEILKNINGSFEVTIERVD